MELQHVCKIIEEIAPLHLQEDWDNSGLLIGNPNQEITGALICFDLTEPILDEAIATKANLVISHHPTIFKGLKRLTGSSESERLVAKAIKHDIAIYAAHTSFDNAEGGVSFLLGKKIGLKGIKTLSPQQGKVNKLVTFAPLKAGAEVRKALFEAGAGTIGNYDMCSFSHEGSGTFRASEESNPYIGKKGELHTEPEVRIEVIVTDYLLPAAIQALKQAHPYEAVAYDIIPLKNNLPNVGSGAIGTLKTPMNEREFLLQVKDRLGCHVIKHTPLTNRLVKKVAVSGGSGAFLIKQAMAAGADVFITGDVKYHDFAIPEGRMTVADAGHFETEHFCTELLLQHLQKKITNFAARNSSLKTNSVNYL